MMGPPIPMYRSTWWFCRFYPMNDSKRCAHCGRHSQTLKHRLALWALRQEVAT